MEDQRNWTDASFKTYSRPLALPFPYSVAAGERVARRSRVGVETPTEAVDATAGGSHPAGEVGPFPAIACGASTAPDPAPDRRRRCGAWPSCCRTRPRRRRTGGRRSNRAARAGAAARRARRACRRRPRASTSRARLRGSPSCASRAFDPRTAHHVTDARDAPLRTALAAAGVDHARDRRRAIALHGVQPGAARIPDDLEASSFADSALPLARHRAAVESLPMQRLIACRRSRWRPARPCTSARSPCGPGSTTSRPRRSRRPTRADLAGLRREFTGAADPRIVAGARAWTVASAAALAVPGVATSRGSRSGAPAASVRQTARRTRCSTPSPRSQTAGG